MANAEEIIKAVAQKDNGEEKKAEATIQLVVFDLDDEEYAVEIKDLQEIIKKPDITPIPNTPDFIRGIFNLRGKIIVVLDLEKRFLLSRQTQSKENNIIITEQDGSGFGIIVDRVTEIINVPMSAIQEAPALTASRIHNDFLKGIVVLSKDSESGKKSQQINSSRLIILLDLPRMLQEKELMSLGKLASNA